MHVVGGVGWAIGLLRENPPPYDVAELAADSGRGESSYTAYDRAITAAAKSGSRQRRMQMNHGRHSFRLSVLITR